MAVKNVRIAVTGAAGQIGYALIFRIAAGEIYGPETEIHLTLLELEAAMPALKGVVLELEDCAFPLLKSVTATSDLTEAFKDADWAILVGSVPRKEGMERADLLKINGKIFIEQGKALDESAKPTCRILVVGNPCNTNAYIAKSTAKKIPDENFFAMTMLDQNRAAAQLAQKAGVDVSDVSHIAIWGNHSTTQYPDYYHAMIKGQTATKIINDEDWFTSTFLETVQKRGAAIIKARGLSSAASAANAIVDTVKNLTRSTPEGQFFSVAVSSDGSYGVEEGLMFGFPVRSNGEDWEIVQGIDHGDISKEKIKATEDELLEEKEAVQNLL